MWLGIILITMSDLQWPHSCQVTTLSILFANVPLSWSKRCNYRAGSSHSSLGSSGTLLIWLQRRTRTVSSTTCQLEEAHWSPKNYLAEDNRWRSSVAELRGPHGLEEGKRQGCLAWCRQYSNALLKSLSTQLKFI